MKVLRTILLSTACILAFQIISKPCTAQESQPDQTSQEPTQESGKKQPEEYVGTQSVLEDILQNTRNHFGFVLGVNEGYSNNVNPYTTGNKSSMFTSVSPQIFINSGRRRNKFHAEFGGSYIFYNQASNLSAYDFNATVAYTRQMTRRTTLEISDQAFSSQNQFAAFSSPIYSPLQSYSFSNELLSNRRMTRNGLIARIDHIRRKTAFGVYGGLQSYRYKQDGYSSGDAVQVGASFDYNITRWLSITNSFTTYFNNPENQKNRIYRIEVAGLRFNLTKSWVFSASGGAEIASRQSDNITQESVTAGLTYESRETKVETTYHRGFNSILGLNQVYYTDSANGQIMHRFTTWMSGTLSGGYYKSRQMEGRGTIETLWGGSSLEFALRKGLITSLNYAYHHQTSTSFIANEFEYKRYIVSIGLQYAWPNRGQ